jgi:hypothetical protein
MRHSATTEQKSSNRQNCGFGGGFIASSCLGAE